MSSKLELPRCARPLQSVYTPTKLSYYCLPLTTSVRSSFAELTTYCSLLTTRCVPLTTVLQVRSSFAERRFEEEFLEPK